MNWKEIENRKQIRWQYEYDSREIARRISEINPQCKSVRIIGTQSFLTGVCPTKPYVIDLILAENDKAYFHRDCLNCDCTGNGFSLTDKIYEAVRSMQEVSGILYCDGKEDWKYVNATGCSCMGKLEYHIIPEKMRIA